MKVHGWQSLGSMLGRTSGRRKSSDKSNSSTHLCGRDRAIFPWRSSSPNTAMHLSRCRLVPSTSSTSCRMPTCYFLPSTCIQVMGWGHRRQLRDLATKLFLEHSLLAALRCRKMHRLLINRWRNPSRTLPPTTGPGQVRTLHGL